jgi:hypothetical protein
VIGGGQLIQANVIGLKPHLPEIPTFREADAQDLTIVPEWNCSPSQWRSLKAPSRVAYPLLRDNEQQPRS